MMRHHNKILIFACLCVTISTFAQGQTPNKAPAKKPGAAAKAPAATKPGTTAKAPAAAKAAPFDPALLRPAHRASR